MKNDKEILSLDVDIYNDLILEKNVNKEIIDFKEITKEKISEQNLYEYIKKVSYKYNVNMIDCLFFKGLFVDFKNEEENKNNILNSLINNYYIYNFSENKYIISNINEEYINNKDICDKIFKNLNINNIISKIDLDILKRKDLNKDIEDIILNHYIAIFYNNFEEFSYLIMNKKDINILEIVIEKINEYFNNISKENLYFLLEEYYKKLNNIFLHNNTLINKEQFLSKIYGELYLELNNELKIEKKVFFEHYLLKEIKETLSEFNFKIKLKRKFNKSINEKIEKEYDNSVNKILISDFNEVSNLLKNNLKTIEENNYNDSRNHKIINELIKNSANIFFDYNLLKFNSDFNKLEKLNIDFPHFKKVTNYIKKILIISNKYNKPIKFEPILIVGNSGLGKTFYIEELTKIINLPLHKKSVTLINSTFDINGLSFGWGTGSVGFIYNSIAKDNIANPIIMFDELDKVSESINSGLANLEDVLLSCLEENSAKEYRDEACSLFNIDISNVNWFFTANNQHVLSDELLNRLKVFHVTDEDMDFKNIIKSIYRKEIEKPYFKDLIVQNDINDMTLNHLLKLNIENPRRMKKVINDGLYNVLLRLEKDKKCELLIKDIFY